MTGPGPRSVLLVNPNTSAATLAMMLAAARAALPAGVKLRGACAAHGPAMILDEAALDAAAAEVVRVGRAEAGDADAVIVAAFGDPGVAGLRAALRVPVVGIGEAALREAAQGGRRFGVATTTPGLVRAIEAKVRGHGLAGFTGVRVPGEDPLALAADPERQAAALLGCARACLEWDGAAVVVIGGGPLGEAAERVGRSLVGRIIAPVPAAMRAVMKQGSIFF